MTLRTCTVSRLHAAVQKVVRENVCSVGNERWKRELHWNASESRLTVHVRHWTGKRIAFSNGEARELTDSCHRDSTLTRCIWRRAALARYGPNGRRSRPERTNGIVPCEAQAKLGQIAAVQGYGLNLSAHPHDVTRTRDFLISNIDRHFVQQGL